MIENSWNATMETLVSFFSRSGLEVFRDAIDVLLVATIIYWALRFVRGTRTMQTAAGLALLLLSFILAKTLGLVTLWSLLDSLLANVVIVIVIIFQSDIRRALTRVGSRSLSWGSKTARSTKNLEQVVSATEMLTDRKIGGLIVWEREAELSDFIENGKLLDARVTKELLYSIFIPTYQNPIHDGAVVLRDDRIWQAGVVLPLSGRIGADRSLGTRHRAGLGITEETDAISIVISEERGSISLCFEGNIVRNLSPDSLRDALYKILYTKPKKKTEPKAERSSVIPPEHFDEDDSEQVSEEVAHAGSD